MNETEIEKAILQLVTKKGYQPVKPRRIARQLGLDDDHQTRELKRVIKRLVKDGQLAYGANHTITAPNQVGGNRVTGIFRRSQKGFGFVRPSVAQGGGQEVADVYISHKNTRDAATGDLVLVQISRRRGGKPGHLRQGEIVKVLERETHRFVGTYFERAGMGLVQVDGTVFSQPILVGDAGAKNVRLDDKVVIEMVRFPSHIHEGEAVILEVLGQRGDPGVDTMSVIHEFNLPREFEETVLDDARAAAERFDESVGGDRRDLTRETVITIDPADARDFDDAISLEQLEGGHWLLGVHIADVSHFVQPKTSLDQEAQDRATSVYLPDRVIPMLPEVISNNLASLQPNRVRYSKSVFIEFTPDGARVGAEACSGAIRSKRRFDYEEVDDYLAHPKRWRKTLKPAVYDLLGSDVYAGHDSAQRRLDHGSLELSMPEVKIDLDGDGRVSGAHLVQHTESHQIIEEFMLAANEAVAELLHTAGLIFLRRIHKAPDPRKLRELTEFASELGFETDSLQSRFELQGLLNDVRDRPEEHAVNYAVLRSMQKAVYSPEEEGHYALASENYCHFTSPIRRYPDLTVHRLLDVLMQKKKPKQHFDELASFGDHCSERERRAEKAERELTKVKLLNYLSERIGEELDGVVTGVQDFGLFVQGIQLPAEGLIHVTSLQDDYYNYESRSHSLSGHRSGNNYRLGDYLRVAVAHVDVDRRQLDFRLVERLKQRPAGPKVKSKTAGKKEPGKRASGKAPARTKTSARPKTKATVSPPKTKAKGRKTTKTKKKTAAKKTKKTTRKKSGQQQRTRNSGKKTGRR